jgi:hypothetical protein
MKIFAKSAAQRFMRGGIASLFIRDNLLNEKGFDGTKVLALQKWPKRNFRFLQKRAELR